MLKPLKLTPYTTNQLSPQGWLLYQLQIQAAGLSGHLDKVWPDVQNSKWIGGDKEGWERVPYWLDGFIPLAYQLKDQDMITRAKRYIDAILAGQQPDGWICPCTNEERSRYDMWALYLICKVLVLYHECSGDTRIEDAVYNALKNLDLHIERHTIFNWAATRWYECLIPLFWLYQRRPEPWMLDLAHKLEEQGTDYEKMFKNWRYQKPHAHGRWSFMTHVVNMGMMLKSRALFSRLTGECSGAFARLALDTLLRDHGMAVGHFTGDECLSGTSPTQGTELCSVAEAMYSYEWLIAITGDPQWSDRLEKAAFNALPATISPDMWTHQYDQLTNQVACTILPKDHFRTNSRESHLFGLEPNYGCCTANFNQAWPKFALSTMMETQDGVAVTAIAPCRLETQINGTPVQITIETDYPFEDGYRVTVETQAPVEFTLHLRIPGSAKSAYVNGKTANAGYFPLSQTWNDRQEVTVTLDFAAELIPRPNNMACLWRGPLLYALPIKEEWQKLEYERHGVERKFPYCDYEIHPKSKWSYAFAGQEFTHNQHQISDMPFNPQTPPVSLQAKLVEISWHFEDGVCAAAPTDLTPVGKPGLHSLIPYGCTNLRMTEMPDLRGKSHE